MALKNAQTSIYGKTAQNVGAKVYTNWLYASFITAYCRKMILDSIATHPGGAYSVLMVATDGICFDSKHPSLPLTTRLGDWEETTYTDLLLFKPGVYWHREGKENFELKVKSRGVPKREFKESLHIVEDWFKDLHEWEEVPIKGLWPRFSVDVIFRMQSCAMAMNQGKWETAGDVLEGVSLIQDSDPKNKRRRAKFNWERKRIDTEIHDLPISEIETHYHGEVRPRKSTKLGYDFDSDAGMPALESIAALRDSALNYNLPLDDTDIEWVTIWEGQ